jgi:MoaA/NifB/PqqE/SkfB family radical SAM enzyme
MAAGSNAISINRAMAEQIIPSMTYLRVNISGGEKKRYAEIMGVREHMFDRVCQNILDMMAVRNETKSACTIGMQMVFQPQYEDQVIPLARLAVDLGVDYLILKHCSDSELGEIGVDYEGYEDTYPTLRAAEAMSTEQTAIKAKWSKISDKGTRNYSRCYGPPFIIQVSGTGLIAPCGMLFNDRYKDDFHIGNICETRFKEIWQSDRYWEVVGRIASAAFDAKTMCGSLCLAHKTNEVLNDAKNNGKPIVTPSGPMPAHAEFI